MKTKYLKNTRGYTYKSMPKREPGIFFNKQTKKWIVRVQKTIRSGKTGLRVGVSTLAQFANEDDAKRCYRNNRYKYKKLLNS